MIKPFKELKKIHWAIVPIVQENQNSPKNHALSDLFLKHPLIL